MDFDEFAKLTINSLVDFILRWRTRIFWEVSAALLGAFKYITEELVEVVYKEAIVVNVV